MGAPERILNEEKKVGVTVLGLGDGVGIDEGELRRCSVSENGIRDHITLIQIVINGGRGGIRTRGPFWGHTLSRRAHSTALSPFHDRHEGKVLIMRRLVALAKPIDHV